MRDTDDRDSYARERAATAQQQAAFFRQQAIQRRRLAEQVRTSAALEPDAEAAAARAQEATRLEALGQHEDAVAQSFEDRARPAH